MSVAKPLCDQVISRVSAYAVEDRLPTGWAVSEINCEGVFDTSRAQVEVALDADTQEVARKH